MPNRVSVKTEDLEGILSSYHQAMGQKMASINDVWSEDHEVKSFTEFREIESIFSECMDTLTSALITLQNRRR